MISHRTVLLAVAVCLVAGTAGKPWVNKAARERRGGYRAHLTRGTDRPNAFTTITFYALGDWGEPGKRLDRVAALLRADVARLGPREVRPFVLGAGDNLYPNGLEEGWPEDHIPGLRVDRAFGDVFARVTFQGEGLTYHSVLGNHDYRGDIYLWETFVEGRFEGAYGNPRYVSYTLHDPDVVDTNSRSEYDALRAAALEGRPLTLPELVPLPSDKVAVIAIDTESMIELFDDYRHHRDDDPPPESATLIGRHFSDLRRLLDMHGELPWVIVLGHHPIASHGPHGGHRPRPLGLRLEKLFEGTKSALGFKDIQDLNHPANAEFAERLYRELAAAGRNVIYVCGHEHSLQFLHVRGNVLEIITGAAAKTSPVGKGRDTIYRSKEPGFVRFDISGDDLWVEFIDSYSVDKQEPYIFRIQP